MVIICIEWWMSDLNGDSLGGQRESEFKWSDLSVWKNDKMTFNTV